MLYNDVHYYLGLFPDDLYPIQYAAVTDYYAALKIRAIVL